MMASKPRPSERGQVLILVVFGIVALIGITALAIDGGNVFLDRRTAQNAADSAALASALARIRGVNFAEKAYESAASNGYNNDGSSNRIQVYSPPIEGEHTGDIEYIQVVITSRVETYFGGIVGRDVIVNRVSAVSRTQTPEVKELLNGYAIVSLAPTSDCSRDRAFWVHSEATLDVTGGGIFVNSNNTECALVEQGNGSIRIGDDSPITVVGGASIQKPRLLTPYPPNTGAVPLPYPPPFFLPKTECTQEAEILYPEEDETGEEEGDETEEETGEDGGEDKDKDKDKDESEKTDQGNGKGNGEGEKKNPEAEEGLFMSPGSWSGEFPPEGVAFLNSGVYCVDEFIIKDNTSLTGSGVTFLVTDGRVDWSGHATIQLEAPIFGPNEGLLMYVPIGNNSKVRLNMNSDSGVRGTILAPSSEIVIKGSKSKYGFHSQIIGYRINADGTDNMIIVYMDEQNYDAMNMPEIELTE